MLIELTQKNCLINQDFDEKVKKIREMFTSSGAKLPLLEIHNFDEFSIYRIFVHQKTLD